MISKDGAIWELACESACTTERHIVGPDQLSSAWLHEGADPY